MKVSRPRDVAAPLAFLAIALCLAACANDSNPAASYEDICGDGVCSFRERCGSCVVDCTPSCGDGACDPTEDCRTCVDCMPCRGTAASYETCSPGSPSTLECANDRDVCITFSMYLHTDSNPTQASFCSMTNCTCDSECASDRFGRQGDCVAFALGLGEEPSRSDCFQRCTTDADCVSGFRCYAEWPQANTYTVSGPVCLPDAGPIGTVDPYFPCASTSDCHEYSTMCRPLYEGADVRTCNRFCDAYDCPPWPGTTNTQATRCSTTNRCVLPCATEAECPAGLHCRFDGSWLTFTCLP